MANGVIARWMERRCGAPGCYSDELWYCYEYWFWSYEPIEDEL